MNSNGPAKARSATVYLVRKEITEPQNSIRQDDAPTPVELAALRAPIGPLYVFKPRRHEERWANELRDELGARLPPNQFAARSAILFVRSANRLFAVAFGYGRFLLRPSAYEVDFGLVSTLNAADPNKLRSVDLRTFESVTLHSRRQADRAIDASGFEFDSMRELLGAVTAEPLDQDLADRMAGRDALWFAGHFLLRDLPEKCAAFLHEYEKHDYKKKFPWFGQISEEREPKTLANLEGELLRRLICDELDGFGLAHPEIVDYADVERYLYPGGRKTFSATLDLETCLAALEEGGELNSDRLKQRIQAFRAGESQAFMRWPVHACLVAEIEWEGVRYILSADQWFAVDQKYAARIKRQLKGLKPTHYRLPLGKGEREDRYNERASKEDRTLACLDKKTLKADGALTPVESCDLYGREGTFIHVKRKNRSSALSHLFSQGVVSAETFLADSGYRARLAELIQKISGEVPSWRPSDRPTPVDFEVAFVVLAEQGATLPFFSQVTLVRAIHRLGVLGFRVTFGFIADEVLGAE